MPLMINLWLTSQILRKKDEESSCILDKVWQNRGGLDKLSMEMLQNFGEKIVILSNKEKNKFFSKKSRNLFSDVELGLRDINHAIMK
ncbi:MAG: hypothetical protein OWS74_02255 [Firmicutes bacterium]|nr:hypothetical protein [Bacillota bacterium]